MSNKRPKEYKQLSLEFECVPSQTGSQDALVPPNAQQLELANVITFPTKIRRNLSFRERVMQELVRNRVMVD
jgi:hypothetical protein